MVTFLSSVTLQPRVDRTAKPLPGLPHPLNSAAPKIISAALVVVAAPLDAFATFAFCAAVTSSGDTVSSPEYSCAVIDFSVLNVASNVAVTLSPVPPVTFFANQISCR